MQRESLESLPGMPKHEGQKEVVAREARLSELFMGSAKAQLCWPYNARVFSKLRAVLLKRPVATKS
jgi:hypothetical protein